MKFELVIPAASPSLNKFWHTHWTKQHKAQKEWSVRILFAIRNSGTHEKLKAHGKRRVIIQRHGSRPLDADNGLGGAKVIIDALRSHGLLIDDDDEHAVSSFENHKLEKGKVPYTVLVLEDL